jgi:hypothetical protein
MDPRTNLPLIGTFFTNDGALPGSGRYQVAALLCMRLCSLVVMMNRVLSVNVLPSIRALLEPCRAAVPMSSDFLTVQESGKIESSLYGQ